MKYDYSTRIANEFAGGNEHSDELFEILFWEQPKGSLNSLMREDRVADQIDNYVKLADAYFDGFKFIENTVFVIDVAKCALMAGNIYGDAFAIAVESVEDAKNGESVRKKYYTVLCSTIRHILSDYEIEFESTLPMQAMNQFKENIARL